MSEDFWTWITAILGVLAIISGLVGWAHAKKSAQKSADALERYKQDAALEIALANQRAAQAGYQAARANEEAAKAILELEKIKERYRPRVITPEQKSTFLAVTSGAPKGKIEIERDLRGQDTAEYAEAIRALFESAGYTTNISAKRSLGIPQKYGVWLRVKDPDNVPTYVSMAITAMKGLESHMFASGDPEMKEDILVIVVYAKDELEKGEK